MKKYKEPKYSLRDNFNFLLGYFAKEIPFRFIRQWIYKKFLISKCGKFVRIGLNVKIRFKDKIEIGNNVGINDDVFFLNHGMVIIEDNVLIGPRTMFITFTHNTKEVNDECWKKGAIIKPITIKKNSLIGAGAIILPGVTIEENVKVGAGAVVTKNIPKNKVVVGIPAKIIK